MKPQRKFYRGSLHRTESIPAPDLHPSGGVSSLLKRLIWLYFWLLIFEGALRKWLLPQFAGPLLIVRDPVVLLIYAIAFRDGVLPRGPWVTRLGLLFAAAVFLFLAQWLLLSVPVSVLLYGLRTFFLHLPLIFVLPRVFNRADLTRVAWWVLLLALPMSILMAYQFKAPADAWINRSPGTGDAKQLLSALGKIRPPGTFSFSTGPVSFFALAAAFFLFGMRGAKSRLPRWLMLGTSFAILVAMAVSGSRSLILAILLVAAVWACSVVASRQAGSNIGRLLLLLAVAASVLLQLDFFHHGTEVLSTRWEMASAAERAEGGMIGRLSRSVTAPFGIVATVPLIGCGLGVGTNVGAALLTGRSQFLLSEEEWGRVVLELGPIVGIMFLLWRVGLAVWLLRAAVRCATAGDVLPMVLFTACASNLVTGQISQPTTLGLTAFVAGLCLCAIETAPKPSHEPDAARVSASGFPLPGPTIGRWRLPGKGTA